MSSLPTDRKYTKSHEWVKQDGDVLTIGITEYAQDALGDLVFVELPEEGEEVNTEDACGVVESVKSASDIFSPVEGEIVGANEELEDSPELVNEDPYEAGWLMKVKAEDVSALDNLLDADAYAEFAENEG